MGQSSGIPVNEADTACRKMTKRYECVMKELHDCVPWDEDYTIDISKGPEKMIETCETANKFNDCAVYACMVEGQFLYDVFDLVLNRTEIPPRYHHTIAGFNAEQNCEPIHTDIHQILPGYSDAKKQRPGVIATQTSFEKKFSSDSSQSLDWLRPRNADTEVATLRLTGRSSPDLGQIHDQNSRKKQYKC